MLQKKTCHEYIISIGSNTSNARQNVETAFKFLKQKFDTVAFSDIIPTSAVGMDPGCIFFNAVARIKTSLESTQLKSFLKETEKQMGRIQHSGDVLIDLDMIVVDGKIVHEDYKNRKFIRDLIQTVENKLLVAKT